MVVPDARYLIDYGTLAEEQACTYACSGLTAYSALKKVGTVGPKDPLLIIGAGGVGLSGIRLARQMFDVAPIVLELDKTKWDLAREAGASEVIDPTADGALKNLIKATGGGVASAVDFVGAAATFNFGFGALRKAGKLVCVAGNAGTDGHRPQGRPTRPAAHEPAAGHCDPGAGGPACRAHPRPDHSEGLNHRSLASSQRAGGPNRTSEKESEMDNFNWTAVSPVKIWRDWIVRSEAQWSETVSKLLRDERAGGVLNRQLDEMQLMHRQFSEFAQATLAAANLPSRN